MMKEFFKKIIIWNLEVLAQMYLKRFKPMIIAVTGNVGKTSAKEAIAAVVAKTKRTRFGKGNLNNEFGVPLTILGDWADEYSEAGTFFWVKVIYTSFFRWFFETNYPEILVLEYGADKPGDIRKLAGKYKPHIAVVTAIGEVPVHVEFFSGPQAVAKEKSKLLENLTSADFAVLNFDDLAVLDMKGKTRAHIKTFGFGEGADIKISNFEFLVSGGNPEGVCFKVNDGDTFVPFRLYGSLGKSQGYAAAAAVAVGSVLGMNLVHIGEALGEYRGPKGRLKILKGVKNSVVIDDTYNASPASTHLALETIRDIVSLQRSQGKTTRAVVVLGDMLELGEYTEHAHRSAGDLAGSFADILVTVGARAKFIADSAYNEMPKENIFSFETSDDAKMKVKELIKEGDLILVKGSQGMRMEKIVGEILAEPEKAKELLVRQSAKWLNK